jgi:filamentous hemagglutinin
MKTYGTGSKVQQAIQAANAALQGIMGGNLGAAAAGASAPYLAQAVKELTTNKDSKEVDKFTNAIGHAIVGALVAQASGNNALSGAAGAAGGELIAGLIIEKLYPNTKVEDLTEAQRQIVLGLSTIAAGAIGGAAGEDMAGVATGANAGHNAVANNQLNSKNVLDMHKELEEAEKTGADKLPIYEKYAEISKENLEKALAGDCSGNPFCANGVFAETSAGSDVANDLNRLPIFSSLSSDDLAQLNRFVLAENEESAIALYQTLPDYVKLALHSKEAIETMGIGAALTGKTAVALGVVGKASKQPYQPNQGAVGNMNEFFKQPGFGSQMRDNARKTSQLYDGQSVYQAQGKVGEYIKAGDKYYLDAYHMNHLEVFDSKGKVKAVLNLDGSYNKSKTEAAIKEGRRLPK